MDPEHISRRTVLRSTAVGGLAASALVGFTVSRPAVASADTLHPGVGVWENLAPRIDIPNQMSIDEESDNLSALPHLRLGVNIDHVATIRNARGGRHPDPVRAAMVAIEAGADGITAHLREDRRHISDDDIARLKASIARPLNLEMAATDEMIGIATRTRPHAACLVPERRAERTTEGGLDAAGQRTELGPKIAALRAAGIRVSLFIAADPKQIETAAALGAPVIEIHTGAWCHALFDGNKAVAEAEWQRI